MNEYISILLAGLLTENMVLAKFLGICSFLGVSKKINTAFSMSVAVTLVMVIASAVTYPVYSCLLVPYSLEYLQTVVFILIIAALVQLIEIVLRKFLPSVYKAFGIYLPLITTNCAILGITILNFTNQRIDCFAKAIVNALGAGLGFMLAMLLFSGVRKKLESCNIPKALQGLPITLIAASIVSLSFMGFSGIV
ncbi:MAG: RnfABCDGE type electron transport complex subunit A [bacterium]|nr:RnfABCDGE type electron transport complex subunit A [bacterium]